MSPKQIVAGVVEIVKYLAEKKTHSSLVFLFFHSHRLLNAVRKQCTVVIGTLLTSSHCVTREGDERSIDDRSISSAQSLQTEHLVHGYNSINRYLFL